MGRAQWLAAAALGAALLIGVGCLTLRLPMHGPGPPAAVPESMDAPRRAARLSYLEGSVSFRAAEASDWAPALLNRPITDGDELWTEGHARAELDLGTVAMRLDSRTSLNTLDLDDRSAQFKITQGTIGILLRRLDAGDTFEIDTPNAAITLLRPGDYRVDVDSTRDKTVLTVHAGTAHAATINETHTVYAPQQGILAGIETEYKLAPAPPLDAFDEFSQARQQCETPTRAAEYVSPRLIGAYELDQYGAWRTDPVWGPVWIPRNVPAGWAPFRLGRWLWIDPWGWSWTDEAPWGFATSHYGRWAFLGDRWSWLPGPKHVDPVYMPATVAFLSSGRNSGHFMWMKRAEAAWFPLGPAEPYIPSYPCTQGYLTDVNITNANIENPLGLAAADVTKQKYANRDVPGAVTAVIPETFAAGGPIGRAAIIVPRKAASTAKWVLNSAPVAPTPFSLSPGMSSAAPRPPEAAQNRLVLVWRVPIPAPPPFVRIEKLRKGPPGRPLDRGSLERLRRLKPDPRPDVRPVHPKDLEPRPGQ